MNLLKKHWKKLLLIVVLVFGIFYYRSSKAKAAEMAIKFPNMATLDPKKDKVITAQLKTVNESISASGKIQASRFARLSFQAGGQLTWVGVKLGDRVKKGQAIASIDKATLQKQLKKQLNLYATNRSNFEDIQDEYRVTKEKFLLTDEIRRILDRTQWSLENAVIDVELSTLAMRFSTLTSPIDGIVVELNQPQAGVYSGIGNIATIVDPESLYFRSELDEEDVVKLYAGQPTEIILDAFPSETLPSKINYIAFDSLESKAATVYEVRFDLPVDNKLLKYRLGMNGNAEIITKSKPQVATIPLDAFYEDKGERFVYKQSNLGDKKVKVPVTTGLEGKDYIEVTSGVAVGDKIVVTANDQK